MEDLVSTTRYVTWSLHNKVWMLMLSPSTYSTNFNFSTFTYPYVQNYRIGLDYANFWTHLLAQSSIALAPSLQVFNRNITWLWMTTNLIDRSQIQNLTILTHVLTRFHAIPQQKQGWLIFWIAHCGTEDWLLHLKELFMPWYIKFFMGSRSIFWYLQN